MAIGFLGLGAIGRPIALRLAQGPEPLIVFDPRAEAMDAMPPGVERAASAKDVGDRAQIVWTCLASADAHRVALLGANGLVSGSAIRTHVHLGTTGPALVREIAAAMLERGVDTVDAPITGGVGRAEAGTLTTMVACPRATLESLRPFFARYSTEIVWLAEHPGAAQVMKLVNNAISLANLAAASEALVVGAKEGLDPEIMLKVLNTGSGQNSATLSKIPRDVITGNFAFGGALRIVIKDLHAYVDLARDVGLDAAVGQVVLDRYEAAASAASVEADVTTVIRPMEAEAGVEVRAGK